MSNPEEYLREAAKRNAPKLAASGAFLALMSHDYVKDAVAMMQLGMAVMMDKPIYLTIPRGQPIPENVKRLARGIGVYDSPEDAILAAERLVRRMMQDMDDQDLFRA